jgi:hypothetical protein
VQGRGSLLMVNSVIHNPGGPDARGVDLFEGGATVQNSTLLGPGSATGAGFGLRADVPLAVMNTLVSGFTFALGLDSQTALESSFFSNALSASGDFLARCDAIQVPDATGLNGTDVPCCHAATPNSGNLMAACALVSPGTEDFHLVPDASNACIDAGARLTPIGEAPPDDLDGESRPPDGPCDIGADEAPPQGPPARSVTP